ncbi:MAG: aminoglycoside N(3)-acetyltransferase [Aggregatilineales bacterium]
MTQSMPDTLHTVSSLQADFAVCGIQPGMTLIMHSSLKQVGGWICGGAEAFNRALMNHLGDDGTLMMPAHTNGNSEPSYWQNPPIPEAWWDDVRAQMPAYHPATTRTRQMGVLVEAFRTFPDAIRSSHPQFSFVAAGHHASTLTDNHDLADALGEHSPLARLYNLDGFVFLMGVGHGNNTSLHLAEHRANFVGKTIETQGAAMRVEGKREWVTFDILAYDADDFVQIGTDFAKAHPEQVISGKIGNADTLLIPQRPLIDFAVTWIEAHRTASAESSD